MSYWQNKVVVVTGGSAGFGVEIATAFALQGAKVVLVARNQQRLTHAATAIGAKVGAQPDTMAADITDAGAVVDLFEKVAKNYGRIDVLVNNVGQSSRGKIEETTAEQFQLLMELNFITLVRCTQTALPWLLKSRGHVVNIGSLASRSASRFVGAYPATKFAVAAYSQQLRLELAEQGLHVLLVCPGPIDRADSEVRYQAQSKDLPAEASRPGAGVKLNRLNAEKLAQEIVAACEKRKAELVRPRKARLLFILNQISPRLGDWLLLRMTSRRS